MEFFHVDAAYFTGDDHYLSMQEELSWMTRPRDGLVADLTRGLLGLSRESHAEVVESIERRLS